MPRKEPSFSERLQTAAKAKQAQMEKIKVTVRTNDAQATERQAERIETEKARQIRFLQSRGYSLGLALRVVKQRGAVHDESEGP